jgi:hypothetical protein
MADGIPIVQVSGGINTEMIQNNKIIVVDAGYINQIREGNIDGHVYVHIKGHNHGLATTPQELSALGTAAFGNWPSVAAGAVIVSDHAQDKVDGTGARSILVKGLDSSWEYAEATIIPTGLTPTAATSQTFIRIDEIELITSGSGLTNAGDISLSISGADIVGMYVNHSVSNPGRRTVPAGQILYLENLEGSSVGNKEVTYHIYGRDNTVADAPFKLRTTWHSLDGGFRPGCKLLPFTEKTDVIIISHTEVAGAKASASMEGWLEVV